MDPIDEIDLKLFGYRVVESLIKVERNEVIMIVQNQIANLIYAPELQVQLSFYENGILRVHV